MAELLQSRRLEGIGEYYFSQKLREIEQLNAQGHHILNLGIGSPDMKPPKEVEEALIDGLKDDNYHQYQSYKGLHQLRSAFAELYLKHIGVSLDSDSEVLPLIGSKEGIMHISMSLLNERDKVLIPNPGYPAYAAATKLAGGEAVHYHLNEDNHYLPDFQALEAEDLSMVKLMWVNYPHMPTGTNGSEELFDQLIQFSRKHKTIIINDNPYGFILTKERHSLLRNRHTSDLVMELNSLSKSHNMSGWRVGVVAGNPDLIQSVLTFKSNMDSGQFKPVMKAAIAALKLGDSWYDELNKAYHKRRKRVFEIACLLTCTCNPEQVGMFVWAKIPEGQSDGKSYADYLLEKYRIFVPPGSVFGSEGASYVRFSLCSPLGVWEEVISRIKAKQ